MLTIWLSIFFIIIHSTSTHEGKEQRDGGEVVSENSKLLPYHTLPVYGNTSLGYYYVNIYIGSPNPQPQSVILDTGSGILAVPCVDCKHCGLKNHIHPPFDYGKSESSKILTCVHCSLLRIASTQSVGKDAPKEKALKIVLSPSAMLKKALSSGSSLRTRCDWR